MKDIFGWVLLGIGSICSIVVFIKSARALNPGDMDDRAGQISAGTDQTKKIKEVGYAL